MKSILSTSIFCCLLLFAGASQAQEDDQAPIVNPKTIPSEGYWVIETNKNNPEKATIFYYNKKNELLKKEEFEGKLSVSKAKTKKWLCAQLAANIKEQAKEESLVKKQ